MNMLKSSLAMGGMLRNTIGRVAVAVVGATVFWCCLATRATADVLYVVDNEAGGLIGELDTNFGVLGQILLPGVTGVAAGPNGHVYAGDATHVYDFSTSGLLLNTFNGFASSHFGDLSFSGQTLYVADNEAGGLIGELDTDFGVLGQILLSGVTGVAAGPSGHVYAADATHVYDFSTSGLLLNTFDGFASSHFGDLSFSGQTLYVADNEAGGLIGELDTDFGVLGQILLPGVTGVAAGPNGHVYADDATHVYDFSTSGQLLNTFDGFASSHFGDLSFFAEAEVVPSAVPEPTSMALLISGLIGLFGFKLKHCPMHRRVAGSGNGTYPHPSAVDPVAARPQRAVNSVSRWPDALSGRTPS